MALKLKLFEDIRLDIFHHIVHNNYLGIRCMEFFFWGIFFVLFYYKRKLLLKTEEEKRNKIKKKNISGF